MEANTLMDDENSVIKQSSRVSRLQEYIYTLLDSLIIFGTTCAANGNFGEYHEFIKEIARFS
jgi:hypothetical protein